MWKAGIRELVHVIQLISGKGRGGPVLDDNRLGMHLGYGTTSYRILFPVMEGKCPGIRCAILGDGQVSRDFYSIVPVPLIAPCRKAHFPRNSGNPGKIRYVLPLIEPLRNIDYLPLTHTKNQQIGRCICKNGLPHAVFPVVVLCKPPQACFDPTDDHGDIRKKSMNPLGIHDGRPIRTMRDPPRRIQVLLSPHLPCRKGIHH
jgi:hypothetical protein